MSETLSEAAKYIHGGYNALIILLFFYQAVLGLRIRMARIEKTILSADIIKKHRKLGPALVLMGAAGFLGGMGVVYYSEGHIFEYPVHFLNGLAITLLAVSAFLISQKIKGRDSKWRTPHFIIGILLLCFYIIQALLGLKML